MNMITNEAYKHVMCFNYRHLVKSLTFALNVNIKWLNIPTSLCHLLANEEKQTFD